MPIEAASTLRAAAADYREATRHSAHLVAAERAETRRDQRIEEAQAASAARPRPQDRAAEAPAPRSQGPSAGLLLDVLA